MTKADVLIAVDGRVGRITLNRPEALNALNYTMVLEIEKALLAWADDPAISLVIIEGNGEKAFCAGGDIGEIYKAGLRGEYDYGLAFWQDEYRLNAYIANYPKPYVAFMHGFVMGGGVGVSAHGSHRIVCETSQISMPECSIGLIPDVGGTHLLGKAPGRIGEYTGLTGFRMGPADAIHADFADYFVPEASLENLKEALVESGDIARIKDFKALPPKGHLEELQSEIDGAFAGDNVQNTIHQLSGMSEDWAGKALSALKRAAPLSLVCTLSMIHEARKNNSLEEALKNELRFTSRASQHGEFLEGIRAAIIDKDRNPKWRYKTLSDIPEELPAQMLAPLDIE